jgi:hypothetical protein
VLCGTSDLVHDAAELLATAGAKVTVADVRHGVRSVRGNLRGENAHCQDRYRQTSPAGRFGSATDMPGDFTGNVREWTATCEFQEIGAVRRAMAGAGDTDTLASIAGAVAEALYGVPTPIREIATTMLPKGLLLIFSRFEEAKNLRISFKKSR